MSFEGTDYEELAQHWGVETDSVELIKKYIFESMYSAYDDDHEYTEEHLDAAVRGDMLEFLDIFIEKREKYKYGTAIFVGLRLVADEDDFTFAQYFVTLLPHMYI